MTTEITDVYTQRHTNIEFTAGRRRRRDVLREDSKISCGANVIHLHGKICILGQCVQMVVVRGNSILDRLVVRDIDQMSHVGPVGLNGNRHRVAACVQ